MDLISESTLKVQESSVSDKIDADICPLCLDVFYTTQELLKHVLETYHISSDSSCSKPYEKSNCDSCHLCPNSDFEDPSDLLKHFFEKHKVSSQPTCDEDQEHLLEEVQQNNKKPTEVPSEPECSTCFEPRTRTFALVPCGHATFCEKCATFFCEIEDKNSRKCPTCRTMVTGKLRVFF